jgi:hypothetical protein
MGGDARGRLSSRAASPPAYGALHRRPSRSSRHFTGVGRVEQGLVTPAKLDQGHVPRISHQESPLQQAIGHLLDDHGPPIFDVQKRGWICPPHLPLGLSNQIAHIFLFCQPYLS